MRSGQRPEEFMKIAVGRRLFGKPMSTTFVSIRGNGFWMNDSILELFLRLLSLHIEESGAADSPALAIRNEWLFASRGYCTGGCPVSLEEHTTTAEGKALILAAIESLLSALKAAPAHLDKGVLNILGLTGEFLKDFESARLVDVGECFAGLIDGKVFGGSTDSIPMPGSPRTAQPVN
jgi:hypothetical protein